MSSEPRRQDWYPVEFRKTETDDGTMYEIEIRPRLLIACLLIALLLIWVLP